MKVQWSVSTDCAVSGSSVFYLLFSCLSEYKDSIPSWCFCQSSEEEEKQIFLQLSVIFHLDSIVLTTVPVGRKKSQISC